SSLALPDRKLGTLGVQLYTVRKVMKSDFSGTLAKVAAAGYKEVEFDEYFTLSPKEVRAALDQAGLRSPSKHVNYKTVTNTFPQALDAAHTVGHKFLVNPWIDDAVREHP